MSLDLRFEDADYVLFLAHAEIAVAEQQHRLMIVRVLGMDSDQERRSFCYATHFVVREREIEPGSSMRGRLLQSDLVFRDRLLKAPQTSQGRA